jgi:hypothetical protein
MSAEVDLGTAGQSAQSLFVECIHNIISRKQARWLYFGSSYSCPNAALKCSDDFGRDTPPPHRVKQRNKAWC